MVWSCVQNLVKAFNAGRIDQLETIVAEQLREPFGELACGFSRRFLR